MRSSSIFFGMALILAACEDKAPPTWADDGLLQATVEGTNVRLSWPLAEDEALKEHRILRDGEEIVVVGGSAREHLVENLDDATTYELTVEAVDEAGNRSEPLHATVTTEDETPPHWIAGAAVRIEGATPAPEPSEGGEPVEPAEPTSAAVVEWDGAEDTGGVATYRLLRDGEVVAEIEGQRHTLDEGLREDERASIAVVAVDRAGNASAPLQWRDGGEAPVVAEAEADAPVPGEPTTMLANPSALMMPNQMARPANLNPAQAAIVDRVRRMGLRRTTLQPSVMVEEQAAPAE